MSLFNKLLDKTIHRKRPHLDAHAMDTDPVGATIDANDVGHDEQPRYEARSTMSGGLNATPAVTRVDAPIHNGEGSDATFNSNSNINNDSTSNNKVNGGHSSDMDSGHQSGRTPNSSATLDHSTYPSQAIGHDESIQLPEPQQQEHQEHQQTLGTVQSPGLSLDQLQLSPSQAQQQQHQHQQEQQSQQQQPQAQPLQQPQPVTKHSMQAMEMITEEAHPSEHQVEQSKQQHEQPAQQTAQTQQTPQPTQQPQQPSSSSLPTPQASQQDSQQQPASSQTQAQQQSSAARRKFNLNDFRVHRTLGTGSFGRVHLVQSRYNSRFYAMKVLKKSEVVRLKQVEHTNNEKMILERVEHPFLINLWGTFQDVRNLYMVMDYVVGGELFSVLRKSQRFPEHVARFYTCEVLLALEYLHSHAVIYRDLKPENLLLDAMGHIKITDFGFAKHVPQNITWTLCGTPDYLAPEIIQSKGYGKAVDWWSMGVLMFEMCAGFPPFFDEDHIKLYGKIMAGKVKYPSHFSSPLKDLLKRLLTADLTKRYGNLRGGATDIKNHPWFEGVNWDQVYSRQIEAPYKPTILGEGDSSNFDSYPEDAEPYGIYPPSETDELGSYFPGF